MSTFFLPLPDPMNLTLMCRFHRLALCFVMMSSVGVLSISSRILGCVTQAMHPQQRSELRMLRTSALSMLVELKYTFMLPFLNI